MEIIADSGNTASGLKLLSTIVCRPITVNSSTCTPALKMNSGRLCWRKLTQSFMEATKRSMLEARARHLLTLPAVSRNFTMLKVIDYVAHDTN